MYNNPVHYKYDHIHHYKLSAYIELASNFPLDSLLKAKIFQNFYPGSRFL